MVGLGINDLFQAGVRGIEVGHQQSSQWPSAAESDKRQVGDIPDTDRGVFAEIDIGRRNDNELAVRNRF